ncbi:hypothetical protein [Erythrobacter sp.]|uniref:hypothetical protein n=1 Tax=Erythrobacter sp. TaxID=1042 RepID=UPI001425C2EF|nr:hypothetical protein [Erythrobacter sp.]QIQ86909.1 MAG: hypothetical protein G9473_09580 [Erythrobacter sp.]
MDPGGGDRVVSAARTGRRGKPLALLGVLLAAWVAGRALFWQSPFAPSDALLAAGEPDAGIAADAAAPASLASQKAASGQAAPGQVAAGQAAPGQDAPTRLSPRLARERAEAGRIPLSPRATPGGPLIAPALRGRTPALRPGSAASLAHTRLFEAAMRASFTRAAYADTRTAGPYGVGTGEQPPPFAPPEASPSTPPVAARERRAAAPPDRWSLDAWLFWREGSDAAPISQGRVPIYGASQAGANLQWRARPSSPHDPRVYARAYRALVSRGESEVALGASARPLPGLPVRVMGEVRVTDGPFATELRPGAFAVTELAPQRLPLAFSLEAYAQAGYVGGNAGTAFADGQVALTREVARFDAGPMGPARFSLGGGAWGGAQEGASRLDVGPTMRLDLKVGEVPARVSVDWRERVGGDAAPSSGVAATVSTRF